MIGSLGLSPTAYTDYVSRSGNPIILLTKGLSQALMSIHLTSVACDSKRWIPCNKGHTNSNTTVAKVITFDIVTKGRNNSADSGQFSLYL